MVKILMCILLITLLAAAPNWYDYLLTLATQKEMPEVYSKLEADVTLFRPAADGTRLESSIVKWNLHNSALFESWRLYNGLPNNITIRKFEVKSDGHEFSKSFEGSTIMGHHSGFSWVEIDLSADMVPYLVNDNGVLLVDALKQTVADSRQKPKMSVLITIEGTSVEEYLFQQDYPSN